MSRIKHSRGQIWNGGTLSTAAVAVTFDVTHTLIHAPRAGELYSQVLERHGITVSARRVRRKLPMVLKEFSFRSDMRSNRFAVFPDGARGWWHRVVERLCQLLELPGPSRFASAELYNIFSHAESWEIYPDIVPALRDLRSAGLRLGIVSNWDERLPTLLGRLGLAPYFTAITYSAAYGREKPHPGIFHQCLQSLGVRPDQALHVGDSTLEDHEGATAAGMHSILIDRGDARPDLRRLLGTVLGVPECLEAPGDGSAHQNTGGSGP